MKSSVKEKMERTNTALVSLLEKAPENSDGGDFGLLTGEQKMTDLIKYDEFKSKTNGMTVEDLLLASCELQIMMDYIDTEIDRRADRFMANA